MTPAVCPLTEAERAYRRGAYQAVHRLLHSLLRNPPEGKFIWRIMDMSQALQKYRDDPDPALLGHYLDEVLRRMSQ